MVGGNDCVTSDYYRMREAERKEGKTGESGPVSGLLSCGSSLPMKYVENLLKIASKLSCAGGREVRAVRNVQEILSSNIVF